MTVFVEYSTDPIRLTEHGVWMHGEDRIIPRVAELFARNIAVTLDGRYVVSIDRYHAPIEVADTAFFVRSMTLDTRDGRLHGVQLVISDGSTRVLDGATLMQSDTHVLYCRVPCRLWNDAERRLKEARLCVPCRFPPALYHELALQADLEAGRGVLTIGQERYVFAAYARAPAVDRE